MRDKQRMGYWGWRPLICAVFISVWVVGCTLNASEGSPTLSPTNTPQTTLTVRIRQPRPPTMVSQIATFTPTPVNATPQAALLYTVRPGDTLLGIALDFAVDVIQLQAVNPDVDPLQLQVGQKIVIPYITVPSSSLSPVAPVSLSLPPPSCYELPTDRVYCLGQVINLQDFPVSQVRVRVRLFHSGLMVERVVGVEREIIWPGQSAPYSALFNGTWDDGDIASAFLHTAQAAKNEHYVQLMIENEQVEQHRGRYVVNFTLYNPSPLSSYPVNLFLLLLDSTGHIVGYRVARTERGLDPDSRLPAQIEAIAPVEDADLTHILYAEARPVS
jgi:LysM repeat protein